jgi:hypothetical protein
MGWLLCIDIYVDGWLFFAAWFKCTAENVDPEN